MMYEIWSVGHKPFEDFGNNKVYQAASDSHLVNHLLHGQSLILLR